MPSCFGNITNLEYLDLSNNKLEGPLPRSLVKCVKLSSLILHHNEFSDIFPRWLEAPQLGGLDLQSNKFHGMINLTAFGLSFPALYLLVISNNNFTGRLPAKLFSNASLGVIDLSNNKFGGPLPFPSPATFYYSIASNKLTGKIPSLICNATKLEVIDLSNNSLTGTLPQSLVKCKYLEVLDLSDNQIEGTFPRWLGTLPELKVLVLRSNNLKDLLDIPMGARLFPKLHILDLSNNSFSGPLPTNLITTFKGMMIGENGQDESLYMTRSFRSASYENSVTVTMKGLEIELMKILTFLTIIDLSCNSFQGNIPESIGNLHSLVGLNLSHNHLQISGAIPRELGDLASLGYLNLSNNQLTGRIPKDKQLGTYSKDSFNGNLGLCGTPLLKACPGDTQPPPLLLSSSTFDREGHESWFKQKPMWLGYASGIVIGISIAYIAFEMDKPKCLCKV
ncbi:uncharacterized protein J3R85_002302 [Psidium guajava]|nr:uncharacterized protein J3R85_002302 [Psidium guajava]